MPNPEIAMHASAGGRAKAARRPLRAEHVAALPALDSPRAAQAWLRAAFEWAAIGKVNGSRALAMVSAIREWGKLREAEATFEAIEQLRATVHQLEADRDRLAQELEQARLEGARS